MEISVKVDVKPLSANAAWVGRRFKTQAYKDFEELMLTMLPRRKKISGPVAVHFDFYLVNAGRTDLDNMIKCCLDCLVKKDYLEDDRLVYQLSAAKHKAEKDSISILINPWPYAKWIT